MGSHYLTVDIDLHNLDTEDLIDELESRGYEVKDANWDLNISKLRESLYRGEPLEELVRTLIRGEGYIA